MDHPDANSLRVAVGVTFLAAFAGSQPMHGIAFNNLQQSNPWLDFGNWTVGPSAGSGAGAGFVASYGDANRYQDISDALFLVQTNINGAAACYPKWNASGFWLRNDGDTGWQRTRPHTAPPADRIYRWLGRDCVTSTPSRNRAR